MPVFITITTRDMSVIWLNAATIVSMEPREDEQHVPYTEIRTTNDDVFAAKEEPAEIIRDIKCGISSFSYYLSK